MSNDLNNIPLDNSNDTITKQQRLQALSQHIFDDEEEQAMAHNFDTEAAEGLADIPPATANHIIHTLNTDLQKKLRKNKKRIKGIPSQQGVYITIITILLLIIVAYVVIKKVLP